MNDLDKDFLQHLGVDNNSPINVLEIDINENLDSDQPQIICHSPYYDANKSFSTLKKSKDEFSVFSTNIQFINAKFDELKLFVEHLKTFDFEFSAICIQESWLTEGDDTSQIQLEGYQVYHKINHVVLKVA